MTWVGLCHFRARFFNSRSEVCGGGSIVLPVGGGTQDKGLGGTHRCVSKDVPDGDVVMDGGDEDDDAV